MNQDQINRNNPNLVLKRILANPSNISGADTTVLQNLVDNYPQSGILQALFACTAESKNFNKASVHFNTKSLYKLINYPTGFTKLPIDKIVIEHEIQNRNFPEDWNVSENLQVGNETDQTKNEFYNHVEGLKPFINDSVAGELPAESQKEQLVNNLQQESDFDILNQFTEQKAEPFVAPEINDVIGSQDQGKEKLTADKFNEAFDIEEDLPEFENVGYKPEKEVSSANNHFEVVSNAKTGLANYHIEAMPYSFLWWLDKTRKEESGNYQPYATPKPGIVVSQFKSNEKIDELQHQYVENIFHVTSVESLEKSTANKPELFDATKKESRIIEKFIKEEPQIKPQKSDKLSTENKAIKSSEDREELVTETLAAIYTQQMLYHKALNAYEKLILKFPEKSRYFADKIEDLKKKTNL